MRKKILFSIVAVFLFLTSLVVLDVGLRFYLYFKSGNKAYLQFIPYSEDIIKNRPKIIRLSNNIQIDKGKYFKFSPGVFPEYMGLEFSYTINKLGFRGKDFLPQKKDDYIRIFTLGGSTTFCTNVTDKETYPFYLQRMLGKNYEVINAGFPSYKMKECYYLFKEELFSYKPDIIIINSAINDNIHSQLLFGKSWWTDFHHIFYNKWMLYTLLLEKYSVIRTGKAIPFFHRSPYPSQEYSKYLIRFIALAKTHSIKVIFIKQPKVLHKEAPLELTLEQLGELYKGNKNIYLRWDIGQLYYVKQGEKISKENGLKVVETFSNKKYFIDGYHLTPEGNYKLADLVAEVIQK